MDKFLGINQEVMARWDNAARVTNIPPEALMPSVRIVSDSSGRSGYCFGLIHNPYRFQRYNAVGNKNNSCNLCSALDSIRDTPEINLFPEENLPFVVIPNKFPTIRGVSLAICKPINGRDKPMYTTSNTSGLAEELELLLGFCNKKGYRLFHNSDGAGATIPQHEHWHLTNFAAAYNIAGQNYGFDAADLISLKEDPEIQLMPGFPFAHLVFPKRNPKKIVSFLENLGRAIGPNFANGQVPHGLCEGERGVLVVPSKRYIPRGIGSGDMAGHILCGEKETFLKADFDYCMGILDNALFRRTELSPEKFL